MPVELKIEIVSDVSCPWCIIGYKSLHSALEKLAPHVTAQITWRPFELNPNMAAAGQLLEEHLREKYGSTRADLERTTRMIAARGADLGFTFNFADNGRIYNTFSAHRLLLWAKQADKQTDLKLALFTLYFSDGGNPSDPEALVRTASSVGLSGQDARKILDSDRFGEAVREDEASTLSMGITMVPTFIINRNHRITGGQPVETFVSMLGQIGANGPSKSA